MSKRGGKNARRHVDKARNANNLIAAWANAPFESGISISARCASLEEGSAHRAPLEDHAGQLPRAPDLRNSVKTRGADHIPPTVVNGVSLVELHTHSIHSDGHLSPSALVQRAARRGVSTRDFMNYHITNILLYSDTVIRKYKYALVQLYKCTIIESYEYTNVLSYHHTNIQTYCYLVIRKYDYAIIQE